MTRPPVTRRNGVKRITATATVLALAGGVAAVPLGPIDVAHAQVAPTQQPGINFGAVQNARGDWEASVFFQSPMTVRTVSIDFVPADSTNPREEAPVGDPVFTRIPEVADYRVDHMRRTQVLASYDVKAYRTQGTSTSGHPTIRITYELPGVEVGQNERLALFAPGMGASYPTPLRGGGARFTRPTVNADIRGVVAIHEATEDEYRQTQVKIRQGAETFSSPVQADGSYEIAMTSPSGTMEISVAPPAGFATPEPKTWQAAEGLAAPDFEVYPISVSGKLIDASGAPVANAKVTVAGRSAVTDEKGNFTVSKVPVGTHDVVIGDTERTRGRTLPGVSVSDQRDNRINDITVETKPQFGAVSGRVTDPAGNGVRNVVVQAGDRSNITDAQGNYAITGIPTGLTSVEVVEVPAGFIRPEALERDVQVNGVDDANFALEAEPTPTPTTSATPTTTKTTPPTSTRPVPTTPTQRPTPTTPRSTTPTSTRPVPTTTTQRPTPTTTRSTNPTSTRPTTTTTTQRPTPTTTRPAPQVGAVEGIVVDGYGDPVVGATVTLSDARGATRNVTVGTDGRVRVDNVTPGEYTVTVAAPPLYADMVVPSVSVRAGETTNLPALVLRPVPARFDWDRVVVKPGETRVSVPTRSGGLSQEANFRTSGVTRIEPDGTTTQIPAAESWISVEGDGTLVARPPRNAAPGEYRVEVTDVTGETHVITVEVADPTPMSEQYAVRFPVIPVPAGATRQAGRPRATVTDGPFTYADRRLPEGTRFSVDPAVSDWVRVDGNGRLTFTPPAGAAPGTRRIAVTVTFPDGSVGTYTAEIEIGDPLLAYTTKLGYEDGLSVRPNEAVTVLRTGAAVLPPNTTFEVDRSKPLGDWMAVVDEHTGNLRVFAPGQGTTVDVPVVAYFADGSFTRLTASVRLSTSSALSSKHTLSYADTAAAPGATAAVALTGAVPEGTTFALVDDGGLRSVDVDRQNGTLKVSLPNDAQLDEPYTTTVRVRYPDGSTEEIAARITATSEAVRFAPRATAATVEVGGSAVIRTGLPPGAKLLPFDRNGWNVQYNPATGELTVEANAAVPPGTVLTVPVEVTFPDGSKKVVEYPVTATGTTPPVQESGSSVGGWIAVVLGALAALAGIGFAAFVNQDAIRAQLQRFGF